MGLPQKDRLFGPDTDLYDRSFQEYAFGVLAGVAPVLSELLGGHLGASLLLREYLTRFDTGQLLLPSFYKHRCIFYRYELFGGCATAIVGMKDSA